MVALRPREIRRRHQAIQRAAMPHRKERLTPLQRGMNLVIVRKHRLEDKKLPQLRRVTQKQTAVVQRHRSMAWWYRAQLAWKTTSVLVNPKALQTRQPALGKL